MNKTEAAKNLFGDMMDEFTEEERNEILEAAESSRNEEPNIQYIVYFVGDKPDTAWSYHHNPEDGKPFGRLEGYWDEDKEEKVSRHYVEHTSKNLKLMDFDTFMENVVPNKDQTKVYDCKDDFEADQFLNNL